MAGDEAGTLVVWLSAAEVLVAEEEPRSDWSHTPFCSNKYSSCLSCGHSNISRRSNRQLPEMRALCLEHHCKNNIIFCKC